MVDVTRVEFERLKGDVQQVFGHSLENRKLIVALGHGLTAVAKTVGTDQAEIDALEASMAEAETDILNLTKLLLALKDQEGG